MYSDEYDTEQNQEQNRNQNQDLNPDQEQEQKRNYYDERYRGSKNRSDSDASGSYGNGAPRGRNPKKRHPFGRILAAIALTVVFGAFCAGISWMAVHSVESNIFTAGLMQGADERNPEREMGEAEDADSPDGSIGEAEPGSSTNGENAADAENIGNNQSENNASAAGKFVPEEIAPEDQIASADRISEGSGAITVVTDVTEVVQKVMPACVAITNEYKEMVQDFWGQTYSQDQKASGSGIIIGQNATELLIVSNNHVVDEADTLYVQFIDGETVQAQVKGTDAGVDLAVVAVSLDDIKEETKKEICIAQMGDSDSLRIGEPAIAIGNALGYGQSVTTGVISALNRSLEMSENGVSNALIQTDAAINPGNSGGALLNIRGEVVGINSNKIGGSVVEGMGYAIPISTAKPIIEELMTHETRMKVLEKERGYLGISCINVTSELSENFGMPEGVFVAQVYEDTGAQHAGLVRGDIITEVAGIAVKTQDELNRQLGFYKAGETIELTIMQGSPDGYKAKSVQLTLSSRKELEAASKKAQQEDAKSQNNRRLHP